MFQQSIPNKLANAVQFFDTDKVMEAAKKAIKELLEPEIQEEQG